MKRSNTRLLLYTKNIYVWHTKVRYKQSFTPFCITPPHYSLKVPQDTKADVLNLNKEEEEKTFRIDVIDRDIDDIWKDYEDADRWRREILINCLQRSNNVFQNPVSHR